MRVVAIIIKDNDYSNTFYPLLSSMKRLYDFNPEISYDEMTMAIKSSVFYHYLAFQCLCNIEPDNDKIVEELCRDMVILFDNDAEQSIGSNNYDGGAWYLICNTGLVGSY